MLIISTNGLTDIRGDVKIHCLQPTYYILEKLLIAAECCNILVAASS